MHSRADEWEESDLPGYKLGSRSASVPAGGSVATEQRWFDLARGIPACQLHMHRASQKSLPSADQQSYSDQAFRASVKDPSQTRNFPSENQNRPAGYKPRPRTAVDSKRDCQGKSWKTAWIAMETLAPPSGEGN